MRGNGHGEAVKAGFGRGGRGLVGIGGAVGAWLG